jgi:predicted MFS family arabinose efflux permease
MLWIILNFEISERKYGWKFFLVILTLLLTLNRSSYLFLLVVLTIYNRKFLWFCLVMFVAAFVLFYEEITGFVFNMSTLESRSELLQGFYISYWNQNSFLGYLFGKGNNFYEPEVVRLVRWQERPDIENGYAMLLHTYGFLGIFGYVVSTFLLMTYCYVKKCYKLCLILLFYFFATQFFTQEFVTNIFYLFIASILTLIKLKNENNRH